MAENKVNVEQQLEQLLQDYAERLPGRIAEISQHWNGLKHHWDKERATNTYRLIHSLAGSAGSFGAAAISKIARDLEHLLLAIIYDERPPEKGEVAHMDRLLDRLDRARHRWRPGMVPGAEAPARLPTRSDDYNNLIYLVDEDEVFAGKLTMELEQDEYAVRTFSAIAEFLDACSATVPGAVIMDTVFAGSDEEGDQILALLKSRCETCPPVVFISMRDDIGARLDAVRAGAMRYFTKPVDVRKLKRTLDGLTLRRPAEPFRVLVIDDNKSVGGYHASVLEEAGMEVYLLTSPLEGLEAMEAFQPDMVLMDVYMPECNGLELAAVIRQDDKYAQLPIVFLSTESKLDKQLAAMHLGGDEFLTKPIEPEHLVQSVKARLKKARWVRRITNDLEAAVAESEHRRVALDEHAIVSIADAAGDILSVNSRFCQISQYSESELKGQNHNIINSGYHPVGFFEDMWQTISSGDIWRGLVCNRAKDGSTYWVDSTIVPFVDEEGLPYQYVSIRTDITKTKQLEQDISRHAELLDALHQAMNRFMGEAVFSDVNKEMLGNLLSMTRSEYGFLSEVLFDDDLPYLKIHAMLHIRADGKQSPLPTEGMEIRGQENLITHILRNGKPVISNDVANDPRRGELPQGHLSMKNFLGVPVYFGENLVGMYGLANRPGGYDEAMLDFLAPFSSSYGVIIRSKRFADMQEEVYAYLGQAKQEAERANRAKSDFLSSMSHELRTPLNAILGFAQLLEGDSDPGLTRSQHENVHEILGAGQHLLELINEVLDLAKIEAGRLDLDLEPVDLTAELEQCRSLLMPMLRERSLNAIFDLETCRQCHVMADAKRLRQALLNYLSNAVKYNVEGGSVRVWCELVGDDMMRINVQDHGPGIPAGQQDLLFTAFNRLETGVEAEGTGIGLVITKRLVENMGGSVGVASEPGQGSTFWMELPMALPEENSVPAFESLDQVHEESSDRPEPRQTLLYVEDNPANLRLVSQLLERRPGINLITSHEPETGLQLAREHRPDLILLDINMPVMDGFEVLRRLREETETSSIPVIAVSAKAMPDDIQQGKAAGFDGYVTKPIEIDDFYAAIDSILQ